MSVFMIDQKYRFQDNMSEIVLTAGVFCLLMSCLIVMVLS